MQNNLEGIAFEQVTGLQGSSYAVFRKSLSPDFAKVWLDISKGFFFLALVFMLHTLFADELTRWWFISIPASGLIIGYIVAYLALFIHEAAHFNIHPNKTMNDRLATIFLCLPLGLSMKSYRKIHWQHHIHLGTPQDAEVSYFHAPTPLFLLETLTGIHILRTMTNREANTVLTSQQLRQSRIMLAAGALLHIGLLVVLFLTGHWVLAVSWITGFGIFFPFFATIRQILEHRDEFAQQATNYYQQPHGKLSRLFIHTVLSSSFGAAGFTHHMLHHWDPQVSYTRLKDIEAFLADSETTAPIIKASRTTYRTVFKKLLKSH